MKTALLTLLAALTTAMAASAADIVATDHQLYTYNELMGDLEQLAARYPEAVTVTTVGASVEGRPLPVVTMGSDTAQHRVMVQAAMHAREYLSAQLVMRLVEHYANLYAAGSYKGHRLSDLFQRVQFVVMPMVNPDGVEIAQRGPWADLSEETLEWVRINAAEGHLYNTIKSNARGVDLNRNFFNGHGHGRWARHTPAYSFFHGPWPYSEPETQAMFRVASRYGIHFFLNYHTCGNVVFHGCANAPAAVNEAALRMARLIRSLTAYPLFGPLTAPPSGTWADEVETYFRRPSATIEVGRSNPVPISEFGGIFEKNKWVWARLMIAIIEGEI